MIGPLISPATSAPVRHLLRQRLSARTDRALVFLSDQGPDQLQPPRGEDVWGYPRPTVAEIRGGEFFEVQWVSLTERQCSVDIQRHTSAPRARYEVAWRVSNPVLAARSQVTADAVPRLITRHIGDSATLPEVAEPLRQGPPQHGTAQVEPPGRPRVIDGSGLTYWFLDPPTALLPASGMSAGPPLPSGFGDAHREAYHFYREVVAGGPVGLAALWLLQRPEEAREVLEWTVANRGQLTDRDGWESSLAATLQGLTEEDRSFVGVQLAQVLSDIGVPQGDEVLRRIEGEGGGKVRHPVNGEAGPW